MHLTRSTVTGLVLLVAGFTILAPQAIGGANTYVLTRGASMLPSVRPGDFVIAREASDYSIGDVVAYRNPQMKVLVLHRIIDKIGNHYVTQGDHNSFTDPYHPSRSDIVGRLWVQLPHAGRVVSALRAPMLATIVFGVLCISALGVVPPASRRERKRRRARVRG